MIRKNMTSLPNAKPVRWVLLACLWAFTLAPAAALAQEEEVERDARLEGYASKVALDNDSTALMWILLIVLGALAMGVMFKNARRTHLD